MTQTVRGVRESAGGVVEVAEGSLVGAYNPVDSEAGPAAVNRDQRRREAFLQGVELVEIRFGSRRESVEVAEAGLYLVQRSALDGGHYVSVRIAPDIDGKVVRVVALLHDRPTVQAEIAT